MPSVINTNIASLNTQRNLGGSQAALNVSIQRLSTGLHLQLRVMNARLVIQKFSSQPRSR